MGLQFAVRHFNDFMVVGEFANSRNGCLFRYRTNIFNRRRGKNYILTTSPLFNLVHEATPHHFIPPTVIVCMVHGLHMTT